MTHAGTIARIALCPDPRESDRESVAELEIRGYELVRCKDGTSLLEQLAQRAPDLLVYMLDEGEAEFALLRLVRRLAPQMPMVLVGHSGSLDVQRMAQSLRPVYYTISPLEGRELSDAVRAGLRRGASAKGAAPGTADGPPRGPESPRGPFP